MTDAEKQAAYQAQRRNWTEPQMRDHMGVAVPVGVCAKCGATARFHCGISRCSLPRYQMEGGTKAGE